MWYEEEQQGQSERPEAEPKDPAGDGFYGRALRKKRRRKKPRYLLKFFVFLLVCTGGYFLLQSDLFAVQKIKVSGNETFTVQKIKEMAGVQKGDNLFNLNSTKAEEKLTKDPHISRATVSKKWPDGVDIWLRERIETAVLLWDKQYVVVDQAGMVLRIASQTPAKLPTVTGVRLTAQPKLEQQVVTDGGKTFASAMQVLTAARRESLKISRLDTTIAGMNTGAPMLQLYINKKLQSKGKAENITRSIENGNLEAILKDLKKNGIKKGMIKIGDNDYFSFNKKLT